MVGDCSWVAEGKVTLDTVTFMFCSKGFVFFISREKLLLAWYPEKRSEWLESAVFFYFRFLGRKKNTALFSQKQKIHLIFLKKYSILTKKKKIHNYWTTYLYQNCLFQTIKPSIYFWQKFTISDEKKNTALFLQKSSRFQMEIKKYP